MQHPFRSDYHYILLSVSPPNVDALALRKKLQDALTQSFGLTSSSIFIDILWIADKGEQFVIRVNKEDGAKLLAAIVAWSDPPRFSLVKESPFLPSLLQEGA
ncbi:hypothetical protein BDZ94DRAFT_615206 [Collybia nuda]|uniref:Ribonucleases P/MRP subunit Pop8-like domain-containing protein n=1 Tax=Collybia nuda TaxID=64659 RepID=A0A9P5Y920_9AGAR|nr:hypothetical protein BDZ94DRAFT_615206 [Collybia nuda]